MFQLRGIKNKGERKAFKELREQALKSGLKTDLPMTAKEYIDRYDGRKKDARSDYYFNWVKQIGQFYERLAKKAQRKIKRDQLEISPRLEFNKRNNEGRAATMANLTGHLRTLTNVTHKNYNKALITPKKAEQLVTKFAEPEPEQQGEPEKIALRVGFKGVENASVGLKAFKGSSLDLAYYNYTRSLSELGYTQTLNTVLKMGSAAWWDIFKDNEERLEAVFNYKFMSGSGSDEYFNDIFTGAENYAGEMLDENGDWW